MSVDILLNGVCAVKGRRFRPARRPRSLGGAVKLSNNGENASSITEAISLTSAATFQYNRANGQSVPLLNNSDKQLNEGVKVWTDIGW